MAWLGLIWLSLILRSGTRERPRMDLFLAGSSWVGALIGLELAVRFWAGFTEFGYWDWWQLVAAAISGTGLALVGAFLGPTLSLCCYKTTPSSTPVHAPSYQPAKPDPRNDVDEQVRPAWKPEPCQERPVWGRIFLATVIWVWIATGTVRWLAFLFSMPWLKQPTLLIPPRTDTISGWQTVPLPDGQHQVQMPDNPQFLTKDSITTVFCETSQGRFGVQVSSPPPAQFSRYWGGAILDLSRDCRILHLQKCRLGQLSGLEMTYGTPSYRVYGRSMVSKSHALTLLVAGRPDDSHLAEAARSFLNSLTEKL